jgi:damage-control phosphatase, subfamily III
VFSDLILVAEISTTMHGLDSDKEELRSDPEKLKILFNEMIQMCLW